MLVSLIKLSNWINNGVKVGFICLFLMPPWILERFLVDELNKQKNVINKAVGLKMKNKEPLGEDDNVSGDIVEKLASFKIEDLKV